MGSDRDSDPGAGRTGAGRTGAGRTPVSPSVTAVGQLAEPIRLGVHASESRSSHGRVTAARRIEPRPLILPHLNP